MKKILLASLVGLFTLAASAQRSIDLKAENLVQPTQITQGQSINFAGYFINNGPDSIKSTDTIAFRGAFAFSTTTTVYYPGPNSGSYSVARLTRGYAAGDTIVFLVQGLTTSATVGQPSGTRDACFAGFILNRSADSVSAESATFQNNIFCKQIPYINTTSIEEVLDASGVTVSPNPAMNEISVSYSLLDNSDVKIRVMDVTGKEIMVVTNERRNAGSQSDVIEVSNLNNGVYFVETSVNGRLSVQKVVVAH